MTAVGTGLEHTAPYRAVGAMQLAGGSLMVAGALLPWLTLLAGLQAYRGILGWNGRGVLVAGAIVALGGAASLVGRAGLLVRRGGQPAGRDRGWQWIRARGPAHHDLARPRCSRRNE